jgi:hypothetical protein
MQTSLVPNNNSKKILIMVSWMRLELMKNVVAGDEDDDDDLLSFYPIN